MSFERAVAIALAVNLFCALLCSFIASRSGHDPFSWALAGGLIGPLGVIALLAARSRDSSTEAPADGAPGVGEGDVLKEAPIPVTVAG